MEYVAAFTQGRAAMWIDRRRPVWPVEDPAASRVVGKVGYTQVPADLWPFFATYGDGIGIAQASKNKKPPSLFANGRIEAAGRTPSATGRFRFVTRAQRPGSRKGVKLPQEGCNQSSTHRRSASPVCRSSRWPSSATGVGAGVTATLSGADPA
jgi:multiple sugar transport system substrate-binding protein